MLSIPRVFVLPTVAVVSACGLVAQPQLPMRPSLERRLVLETALEHTQRLDVELRGWQWLFEPGALAPMTDLLVRELSGRDEERARSSALLFAWNRELLADREEFAGTVRSKARAEVGAEGDLFERLLGACAAGEEPRRSMLLPFVGILGTATPDAVGLLAHAAAGGHVPSAWRALWAIGWLPRGKASTELVPVLLQYLRGSDSMLRLCACWALVRVAPERPELVGSLADLARDGTTVGERRFATLLLAELGTRSKDVLRELVRATPDPTRCIPEALQAVPADPTRLGDMSRMIRCDNPLLREEALRKLAALGAAARPAAPDLITCLTQTAYFLCRRGGACLEGKALASIDPDLALRELVPRLSDDIRHADYAHVLIELGPALRPAATTLVEMFRAQRDPVLRTTIARVLVAAGPAAALAVAGLVRDLRRSPTVACLDVLASIGNAADPAVPSIRDCLEHESAEIRAAAERALTAIVGK